MIDLTSEIERLNNAYISGGIRCHTTIASYIDFNQYNREIAQYGTLKIIGDIQENLYSDITPAEGNSTGELVSINATYFVVNKNPNLAHSQLREWIQTLYRPTATSEKLGKPVKLPKTYYGLNIFRFNPINNILPYAATQVDAYWISVCDCEIVWQAE